MSNVEDATDPAPTPDRPADARPLGYACRYCGSADTWIESRLEVRPPGTYSLAGAAIKYAARSWPHAVCGGCGHVSRGTP